MQCASWSQLGRTINPSIPNQYLSFHEFSLALDGGMTKVALMVVRALRPSQTALSCCNMLQCSINFYSVSCASGNLRAVGFFPIGWKEVRQSCHSWALAELICHLFPYSVHFCAIFFSLYRLRRRQDRRGESMSRLFQTLVLGAILSAIVMRWSCYGNPMD